MQAIHQLLKKYWGYDVFRPLQEDIINAVLHGTDTLALLPTGGGKSICFQVPALAQEGICIVISPLIALIKDQVDSLLRKNIKAIAITSDMNKREIDIAFDNCVYGNVKFLYISPERLETEIAQVRLQKMNVNLIAIDEAHCISQWGYDFRPSYLQLKALRTLLPKVPILALTATATPRVVNDIQEKLGFKKRHVLQKSFERKNLAYVVLHEEDKLTRIVKIAKNLSSSGIIYVRNRKKTKEIADYLKAHTISADYYHAGLDSATRSKKQTSWMLNQTRIIVCTNAFGMGIDKPDVGFVVHADVPESLEAYFQEAGRAGRNETKAYAILLYTNADKIELERNIQNSFPSIDTIRNVYQALANFYQLPTGAGLETTFNLDIAAFCTQYNFESLTVFNSLKILAREGYISFTEGFYQAAKLKIELNREELYQFQLKSPQYDSIVQTLLRNHTALFENFVTINEYELAKQLKTIREHVVKKLVVLHQYKVINYIPETELPHITFERERVDAKKLTLSHENFVLLKKQALERMQSVVHYASSTIHCRSQLLLAYFGETNTEPCNQCDVCLAQKNATLSNIEFDKIVHEVKQVLMRSPASLVTLIDTLNTGNEDKRIQTIQWMLDNNEIHYDAENLVCLSVN
jgi:ATP-dependent DNA helicase RecQ